MNLTFIKTAAIAVFFLTMQTAQGASFSAKQSGNFSDTATWFGNVVPPTTLDTNRIRLGTNIVITLDQDLTLNSQYSEIEFLWTGSPGTQGKIVSTTKNHISVTGGRIFGIGTIDIDSMYIAAPLFIMSGTLILNKMALNATEFDPTYSINTRIRKEMRMVGGNSIIQRSAAVVALDTNADIVYGGGILGVGPNSLNVSKGYNIRYMNISYVHNNIQNLNTLNEFEVAVGTGNTVRMTTDVLIPKKLLLTSGSLKTDGYMLIMGPLSSMGNGGSGNITGTASTRIVIQSNEPQFGAMRFSGTIGNLKIESPAIVQLGTDLNISNSLDIAAGMLQSDGFNTILSAGAILSVNTPGSYIITNNNGQLKQHITASGNKLYPIGSMQDYAPVTIGNNTTGNYDDIGVSVSNTVFSYGTYGYDMAQSEPVVNALWTVTGNNSNIDFSIEPQWNNANEKNGFDANNCYVSHYTNWQWDKAQNVAATVSGNTKTVKRTSVNNFGAFTVGDKNAFLSIGDNNYDATNINLYPNPATEIINLNYTGTSKVNVAVYNAVGIMVKTFTITNGVNPVNISGLSSGMYYIHNTDGDEQISTKFLKL